MPYAIPTAAAAFVVATAGTLTYAALSAQSQIFGRTLIAPAKPNEIAVTYDDGPNPAATPQLLEVLARHNVHATFFLIGNFARECPALVREIAAAGHLIGNHTTTHPWLPFHSAARIRQELADCNAALEDILGAPIHFFRAPHGARRPFVLRVASELNLTPVQWNIITGDWKPIGAQAIAARAMRGISHNQNRNRASNIVLHDGGSLALNAPRIPTVEATDQLLQHYKSTETNFVTLEAWS
jgi:peptidoglycan-N-acetylglucosamine deacetylase